MKQVKILLSSLLLLVIAGCSSIMVDRDHQIDLTSYQSFSFNIDKDQPLTLDEGRMKQAVTQQLELKGLALSENSSLLVKPSIQNNEELISRNPTVSFGYSTKNIGVATSSERVYQKESYGNIVIELIDKNKNQIVWRGVSNKKITKFMSDKDRSEIIFTEIDKMFTQYP
ncbi:DUF4136 domain-containing protein [Vibrio sp. SS-MA-C1-2]|uniref:DUF4136 domain-containing protein n=1 Tax=Vibrio sp. SS-MA-C1-2 TaxID=2908646 RepID=UPI001F1BC028|nr:DUF4136 domain-containing protein [Vibrio sp. SS-MA-C1-2]UJF17746.1 DUF4136 domain-containing protein [Vibrio sp. SS-MA-C1-2]